MLGDEQRWGRAAYEPAETYAEQPHRYAVVLFGCRETRDVRGVLGEFGTEGEAELFAVEARFTDYLVAPVCPVGP